MNSVRPLDAPQPVKLTVDDFLLLAEAGAFDHLPKKVELLNGVVTVMSPQYAKHSLVTTQLAFRLQNRLIEIGSPVVALINGTLTARPSSAPEPDIFLTSDAHTEGYATAAGASLVVEVSHTTARHDLGEKRRIYAAAEIPEYWVFEILKARIHRFWRPENGDYTERDESVVPGSIASVLMPQLVIGTDRLI